MSLPRSTVRLFLMGLLASAALPLAAQTSTQASGQAAPKATTASDPRAAIAAKFPEIRPEQVTPSPVAGLYEVRVGSNIAYVTADGRFLVQGEIIDLNTDENLTETRRGTMRRDVLAGISESGMVVFAPAKYQSTITVFTDIDCGYCRKLHRQMSEYNARGIRVRYMFFPRSGPGSESWTKAEQVSCAADQRTAMTRAKLGEVLKDKPCQDNDVARHFNVGREFGIQGTPAIILDSGELIGGYLEPAELSKFIAQTRVAQATAKNPTPKK